MNIDDFFTLMCNSKKRITIFCYNEFVTMSFSQFRALQQSFLIAGDEYRISNNVVTKIKY